MQLVQRSFKNFADSLSRQGSPGYTAFLLEHRRCEILKQKRIRYKKRKLIKNSSLIEDKYYPLFNTFVFVSVCSRNTFSVANFPLP